MKYLRSWSILAVFAKKVMTQYKDILIDHVHVGVHKVLEQQYSYASGVIFPASHCIKIPLQGQSVRVPLVLLLLTYRRTTAMNKFVFIGLVECSLVVFMRTQAVVSEKSFKTVVNEAGQSNDFGAVKAETVDSTANKGFEDDNENEHIDDEENEEGAYER